MTTMDDIEDASAARKLAVARASIAASALLAVAKLVAGLWSGSLSLLSEAGHAAVDTCATILTYFAVREADKPADAEHHYGHGKIEALAALVETGVLFGLALFVVGEAARRLTEPEPEVDAGWPAFAVLGVSILVDLWPSRQLLRVAKEEGSDALAADALHFASDLIASILVAIGLAATRFGFVQGDALAAFGVALFIAVAGYRLGRRTIETLLDAAPSELVPQLQQAIGDVPGVIAPEALRLRQVGQTVIGEATFAVSRALGMEEAAHLKQEVAAAIEKVAPGAQVALIAVPRALDSETVVERVMLVAARRRLPVHHIVAQQVEQRLSISLDLELDAEMPMGKAHALATELENAIRDEFGAETEIETHIEPLAPPELMGRDADPTMRAALEAALARYVAAQDVLHDVHDIRVRGTRGGLVVNYHCQIDDLLTVEAAHEAIDAVERRLREEFPTILRIVGHCEPAA
jgi:cation diffusion facilitator family transporter